MKFRFTKEKKGESDSSPTKGLSRRSLLKKSGLAGLFTALFGGTTTLAVNAVKSDPESMSDAISSFFQQHYQKMTPEEIKTTLERLEREAKRVHGAEIKVSDNPPIPGVVFGYGLNLSRCKGIRKCVTGCVEENNQSRDPPIQYIRVLEMLNGKMDLNESEHFFDSDKVPREGHFYLPVQCHQCENPPCVKNCPVGATWKEPDGIVVIDYNWCIGCRYCMAGCPYWARRFNWSDPQIPADKMNPHTHFLGNRPRYRGVVEKCTFCIQRTRQGRLPACLEACPTGARVFGNLLDPKSEIRYVLEHKKVFRLKEDLGTQPKFWYYYD